MPRAIPRQTKGCLGEDTCCVLSQARCQPDGRRARGACHVQAIVARLRCPRGSHAPARMIESIVVESNEGWHQMLRTASDRVENI